MRSFSHLLVWIWNWNWKTLIAIRQIYNNLRKIYKCCIQYTTLYTIVYHIQCCIPFLFKRTQSVLMSGTRSTQSELQCGISQGSVLGPILFLYTADVMQIADRHGLSAHSYADDTQLKFHEKADQCLQRLPSLEACVNKISEWMSSKWLKLNTDKTQFIWLGIRQQLAKINCPTITLAGNTSTARQDKLSNYNTGWEHVNGSPR